MKKKPNILITNDDGIHAAGIKHLWNALKDFANLTIVAPSTEQSAVGLSITIRSPLQIQRTSWHEETKAWAVTGTPADCVKMALSVILPNPPDIIVSGINRGSNAGRNVLYSGTVGGVIEGILHDIPGIAFSCREFRDPDYEAFEKYIPAIVSHTLENGLPRGTLLNVNFPENSENGVQGFRMTSQGKEFWGEDPDERSHPAEGHSYYWMGAKLVEFDEGEDSDITWLKRGFLTAVPVHVSDLTDQIHLSQHRNNFDSLFDAHFVEGSCLRKEDGIAIQGGVVV